MKEVIKTCLDKYNNTSYSNDELSDLILGAIKTSKWYLNLNDNVCKHNNDLLSNCQECDEEQVKESWICGICGKSTYAVEWDYIGSGTNHLGCELKIDIDNKAGINPNDDIEYREKDWLEKKLQYEIFKSDNNYEK